MATFGLAVQAKSKLQKPLAISIASLLLSVAVAGCSGDMTLPEHYPPAQSLVIETENLKPGNPSWELINAAADHQIEGYASAASVNRGGTLALFVNALDPSYTLEVFRLGWYGGIGARSMGPAVTL